MQDGTIDTVVTAAEAVAAQWEDVDVAGATEGRDFDAAFRAAEQASIAFDDFFPEFSDRLAERVGAIGTGEAYRELAAEGKAEKERRIKSLFAAYHH